MLGNESCREAMRRTIGEGRNGTFFVLGPWGLGKRAFLNEVLDERGLIVDSNIDGVRSIKRLVDAAPSLDDAHDTVILDCDRMSMPAQDACLKLLEETPAHCRVWIHASDPSGIGKALLSRKREEFRWGPVPRDEMAKWAAETGGADELLLDVAAGRPGCYSTMRVDPRFKVLHETLLQAMAGSRSPLMEPLPTILSELDGETPLRESIFLTIRHAAKTQPSRAAPLLKYAAKILSSSALNAELHWFTALSHYG